MEKIKIFLYPTDTLYGLGVDATDANAIRALKDLKGRTGEDAHKPISIIVADLRMAGEYAVVTPLAEHLAQRFLPGKLTLVLDAKDTLPKEVTAGTGTVGIRIPNHPVPIRLVRELGRPITATSANLTGMPTKRSVDKILAQFGEKADTIYHSGDEVEILESAPSTVVDVRGDSPIILREGAVAAQTILESLQ